MSEGTVRQWSRVFKYGQTDVHDKEQSDWLSEVSDLVQSVDQKFVKYGTSQFQNIHVFPQISTLFSTRL
jgi:hypothetical protein